MIRLFILCGLALALLVGCMSSEGSGQAPDSTTAERDVTATMTAEPAPVFGITPMPPPFADRTPELIDACDPDSPIQVSEDDDRMPPLPPEELVARGELHLTARVVEVLPSRWTTPDGSRPEPCLAFAPFGYSTGSPPVEIITPVIVEFDGGFVRGDFELLGAFFIREINPGDQLVLIVAGGEVNGDLYTNRRPGSSPYTVGDEVVLSLMAYRAIPDQTTGYGVPWHRALGTAWYPIMKWTVAEDGIAVGDYNASDPAEMPLDELLERLSPVAPTLPTAAATS